MPQITSAVAEIVEATTEQITVAFPTYDSEAERHDLYRHTESMQGAPIRNGTKIAEDIDPSQDYVDDTVDPYQDYNYQLVSITVSPAEVPEFTFIVDSRLHRLSVSNAVDEAGNGLYIRRGDDPEEELSNTNGWYFIYDDGTWRLFDDLDNEQATGSGDIGSPDSVTSWSGNEDGISTSVQNAALNEFTFQGPSVTEGSTFPFEYQKVDDPSINDTVTVNVSSPVVTFPEPGTYLCKVGAPFNTMNNSTGNATTNERKILEILHWGSEIAWTTMFRVLRTSSTPYITIPNTPLPQSAGNLEDAFRTCFLNNLPHNFLENSSSSSARFLLYEASYSGDTSTMLGSDFFKGADNISTIENAFYDIQATVLPPGFLDGLVNLRNMNSAFDKASGISVIPDGFLDHAVLLRTASSAFNRMGSLNCSPTLFNQNKLLYAMGSIFGGNTALPVSTYSQMLVELEQNNPNMGVSFGAQDIQYTGAAAIVAKDILEEDREITVTGASDSDADGAYSHDSGTERYTNISGFYFEKDGTDYKLYNSGDTEVASGTGRTTEDDPTRTQYNIPHDATGWTGVLSSASVTRTGAGWTIADGGEQQ